MYPRQRSDGISLPISSDEIRRRAVEGLQFPLTATLSDTGPPPGVAISGSVVAMASLLWFGFPIRRRRPITQLGLLLIATLIGAAIGCGGGKAAAPPSNAGTTPGAYTVTVTHRAPRTLRRNQTQPL